MNMRQYADHRGVSVVAVHKWIKTGKLGPLGEAVQRTGRLYLIDSDRADLLLQANNKVTMQQSLLSEDHKNILDLHGKKGSHTYGAARTLDAQYGALLKKLQYEIQTGVYVLAEDVRAAAYNHARVVRDSILNIPDRVAPIVAAEPDPEKVRQLLMVELEVALEELSTGVPSTETSPPMPAAEVTP